MGELLTWFSLFVLKSYFRYSSVIEVLCTILLQPVTDSRSGRGRACPIRGQVTTPTQDLGLDGLHGMPPTLHWVL